jgi:hypothetical protein
MFSVIESSLRGHRVSMLRTDPRHRRGAFAFAAGPTRSFCTCFPIRASTTIVAAKRKGDVANRVSNQSRVMVVSPSA